jgi:pimeloyl-ACP methyl ester carboxylesterase|tara:strand:+ start:169 stop:963 length:795 start_codon:yes stop_codon:yes gene_type:complete
MSKPLINFVHANGFPSGSYQTLFNLLTPNFEIVANSKYGHDQDFPVENNWQPQVDELIQYTEQQLKKYNQEKLICIGHSFGGVIAFMAACQKPDLFSQLVMLDPPVFVGSKAFAISLIKHTKYIDKFSPAGKAKSRRRTWPLEANIEALFSRKALFSNFDKRCLHDYVKSGFISRNNQIELVFDADVEANIFRKMVTNLYRYKNKLTVPATLVYGTTSNLGSPDFFKKFRKLNKNIVLESFEGGHMFPLEKPEETVARLQAIIK